ncbi:MAG: CotH kinase family protein [Muribaculaceae bacterium]|nr:CotH kinase family protein [Muribaculaceae bacterium]
MKPGYVFLTVLLVAAQALLAVEPTMTIPVLYIETENHKPVDSKEAYVEAKAWIDASMTDDYESLGSAAEPLLLGIRGRGNASWISYEKKPYKLKFVSRRSPLGLTRSKHFALIHYPGANSTPTREPLGFELGRRIGLGWTPGQREVEVVLNGDYLGWYYLTESIKVDPLRVDITEQADLEQDADKVENGWLVEIDNYADDYQTIYNQPDGKILRLTHKSPEVLSEVQQDYIDSNFEALIEAVFNEDSDDWKDYIDPVTCARYYIVQEVIHNYDAFNGSFYLYKEGGSRWTFGPLWDLAYSLDKVKTAPILDDLPASNVPKLMTQLLKFDDFRLEVIRQWSEFYESDRSWIDRVAERIGRVMDKPGKRNAERWQTSQTDLRNGAAHAASLVKANIEWLNGYFASDRFMSSIDEKPMQITPPDYGYRLEGQRVYAAPGTRVYDLGGNEVFPSDAGGRVFDVSAPGVYIIRNEAGVSKIHVR